MPTKQQSPRKREFNWLVTGSYSFISRSITRNTCTRNLCFKWRTLFLKQIGFTLVFHTINFKDLPLWIRSWHNNSKWNLTQYCHTKLFLKTKVDYSPQHQWQAHKNVRTYSQHCSLFSSKNKFIGERNLYGNNSIAERNLYGNNFIDKYPQWVLNMWNRSRTY